MKLILSSASPRRKQILAYYGYEFEVIPSNEAEIVDEAWSPVKTAETLALQKAQAVFRKYGGKVIGCDTVVALGNKIFGKPKDESDAKMILKALSGKCHDVISGFAIVDEFKVYVSSDVTKVWFNELNDEIIEKYIATGSPLDKAGAYGIQDNFGIVKKYEGSYNNVVGLPIEKIESVLKKG